MLDLVILSNAPGELLTWVRPVVRSLRDLWSPDQARISVVLSPCANASGNEVALAQGIAGVDRVQGAADFLPFLLVGRTAEGWDWQHQGVVIFLGGDQAFAVIVAKRLGYQSVIYAEWEARWQRWGDRYAVMRPELQASASALHKFTVVGDLMAEAGSSGSELNPSPSILIGLLPGSKPMKLGLGVPLFVAIAEQVWQQRPAVQFVIPVAPALPLAELARYGDPAHNPVIEKFGWARLQLVEPDSGADGADGADGAPQRPYLKTSQGLSIQLESAHPAYATLRQCALCITTVGANTAELGCLGVPMLVLLPTQQLEVMKAWDGLPGLVLNLPVVGDWLARRFNAYMLKRLGLLAWPNIWAKRQIVPELVGALDPQVIALQVLDYLDHPDQLAAMRQNLRAVRGQPGAADKIAQIVRELV